jgi:hypothetical protein
MVSINFRVLVSGHYPHNKLLFYKIYTLTYLLFKVFFAFFLTSCFLRYLTEKCSVLIALGISNDREVCVEIKTSQRKWDAPTA